MIRPTLCASLLLALLLTFVPVDRAAAFQGPGGPGGVRVSPGEECPPGTTEVRPGNCRAPEVPAPSILDYRPESTLVTKETLVPRARFPVVDVHGHARDLTDPGRIEEIVAALDSLNIRIYIAADNLQGERLRETLAALRASPHGDRFRVMAGLNFDNVGPGWGERAARQLEEDIRAGAIGVGEIGKGFGMSIRKADGTRLAIDDPELDPVWETLARLGVPAFIHTADPPEFWEPFDYTNERWLELALFPNRRAFGPDEVPFEQLIEERNNLFRRHPETTFIAAHFGWHAHDLARAAKLLDEFPNVYLEVGAVLYDFGRQPRAAREFFIKYQDRILFGKDSFQPVEYPYYWRVFETDDEYFDYYRDYHAFWKLYGMDLPDEVLRKLYYGNALKLFADLPRDGW
ncbi:MAG TPA: amidohydrolase family protein [Longimicrobiaceae bacterium]